MILSVSRRTDIPNYYSEWFYNRMKDGYLYVRNPMNTHQISKINLSPEVVDCIVFWTKNPAAMMPRLKELRDYNYCFHFTITGYGKDIEPFLPNKRKELLAVFRQLSEEIGCEKMVWRYDPILFNEKYVPEYHLRAFEEIAGNLRGFTRKVFISLVDLYAKTKRNIKALNIESFDGRGLTALVQEMARIADKYEIKLVTCAAQNRLTDAGINSEGCVLKEWIEQVCGCRLKAKIDKNQREGCRCIESIDIGAYNTCLNGCRYCYANYNEEKVNAQVKGYHVDSPLLCGNIEPGDIITERKVKSLKEKQIGLFDD